MLRTGSAKHPGFADALIVGTTGLRSGRSVVEGALIRAEKDPGFFAALRMTKEVADRCFLLNAAYAEACLQGEETETRPGYVALLVGRGDRKLAKSCVALLFGGSCFMGWAPCSAPELDRARNPGLA